MHKVALLFLAILPKFTSSLSALGSSMIISQVLTSKKNRSNQQQRIICVMSVIDLLVSSVWFFTNLFIPSDVKSFPWAVGNPTSCSVQGFIVQFSISSVLYNASLSFYYVLVIKYKYRRHKLQKVEKYIHFFPIMFGLVTAVTALKLHVYNFAVWDCWIAPDPNGNGDNEKLARVLQWSFFFAPLWCAILYATNNMVLVYLQVRKEEKESMEWLRKREAKEKENLQLQMQLQLERKEDGMIDGSTWLKNSVNSTRSTVTGRTSDNTSARSSFILGNTSPTVAASGGENGSSGLVMDIETGGTGKGEGVESGSGAQTNKENGTESGTVTGTGTGTASSTALRNKKKAATGLKMKHTKSIATQGMLYVGAFFITWLFPTISRIIQLCGGTIPPALVVLSATSIPSQGIFNAMVYFRLRFIQCGKDFPNKSYFWRVTRIIKSTVCPCFLNVEHSDDGNDVEPSVNGSGGSAHGNGNGNGNGGHEHGRGNGGDGQKNGLGHGHGSNDRGDGFGQKLRSIPSSSPADCGRLKHGSGISDKHIKDKGKGNRNDQGNGNNDNSKSGDGSASESFHRHKSSSAFSNMVSYPSSLSERNSEISYNVSGSEEFSESQFASRTSEQSSSCSYEGDGCKSSSATGVPECTGTAQQQSLSPAPCAVDYYRIARDMVQSGDFKKPKLKPKKGIPMVPIPSSALGGEFKKGVSKYPRTYRDILNERRMAVDGAGEYDREWMGNGDRVLDRTNLVADLSTIVEDSGNGNNDNSKNGDGPSCWSFHSSSR